MDKPCDWDFIWINVCDTIAKRSRDPSTKCGAVLVSPDYRRVHLGYNNFPPEIKDTYERWNNRKIKYSLVVHAEMGAIINSKEDLSGWTLYVSIPPCSECARYIIMAGIKRIVYKNDPNKKSQLDYKTAKNMFKESNVILQKYGGAHD